MSRSGWLRDYTVLVLRLQEPIRARTGDVPVEEYRPPEWYEQVQHEPARPADMLVRDAQEPGEALPQQEFEPRRTPYLAKQLRALETVGRRLRGERFPLREEVSRCFDLDVDWLPESIFEQAYTLYDEALPGSGSLSERLQRWRASFTLPPHRAHLLPTFLQRALAGVPQLERARVPRARSEARA